MFFFNQKLHNICSGFNRKMNSLKSNMRERSGYSDSIWIIKFSINLLSNN